MEVLDFIIILSSACFSQVFLHDRLLTDKFEHFLSRFTKWNPNTYEKAEYLLLPFIGAIFVLLLIHPQGVLAQAGAGLTWSTTIEAIYIKAKKSVEKDDGSHT